MQVYRPVYMGAAKRSGEGGCLPVGAEAGGGKGVEKGPSGAGDDLTASVKQGTEVTRHEPKPGAVSVMIFSSFLMPQVELLRWAFRGIVVEILRQGFVKSSRWC